MADVSITASAVLVTNNTITATGRAGATITAGQTVYADSTDNGDYKLADADSSDATAECKGIALNGAADGQPLEIATGGDLTMDGLTAGELYVVSGTPGGLAPEGDLGAGDRVTFVGVAKSATSLSITLNISGVTL